VLDAPSLHCREACAENSDNDVADVNAIDAISGWQTFPAGETLSKGARHAVNAGARSAWFSMEMPVGLPGRSQKIATL